MKVPLVMQYELAEGGYLFVFLGDKIAFSYSLNSTPTILNTSAEKIVSVLLENKNKEVSYDDLYCAYKKLSKPDVPFDELREKVQKMVYTIPKKLRDSIDNSPKQGYTIRVARELPIYIVENTIPNKYQYLAGEYIALYLSPDPHDKTEKMLGAFIQIQKQIDSISVDAIFDIQSNQALLRVSELFSGNVDYSQKIAEIRKEFPEVNTNCWFSGVLQGNDDNIATIALKSKLDDDKRTITLDISDFLTKPNRTLNLRDDRSLYRGGLGIVTTCGRTEWELAAYRILVIRKSWYIPSAMGLNAEEFLKYLKTEDCVNNSVNTTRRLDHNFYNWLLLTDSEQQFDS